MPPSRLSRAFVLAQAILLGTACSDPSTPTVTPPRIEVAPSAALSDTIEAEPVQALVITVQRAGAQSGLVVRFETDVPPITRPFAQVSALAGTQFGNLTIDTTNGSGRAATRVKLGWIAGPAIIRIVVPELGLIDTVTVTVKPGHPAGVLAAPRDTALLVGGSFQAQARVVDRFGNTLLLHDVSYRSIGPELAVNGNAISAVHAGLGRVVAEGDGKADTMSVSVIADGGLSAIVGDTLVTFRTDGSDKARLSPGSWVGLTADWSPDGASLAIGSTSGAPLQVLKDGQVRTPTLGGTTGHPGLEIYPKFSADGQWLYYSRNDENGWRVRRARLDGTTDEEVIAESGADVAASPSPDGTAIAYVVTGPDELRRFDVATQTSVHLSSGHSPAWSPKGDLIAFVRPGAGIFVINPDGSGIRQLGPAASYQLGIDWSPDGEWIVADAAGGSFQLIQVTTGLVLPLGYTTGAWTVPAWRR